MKITLFNIKPRKIPILGFFLKWEIILLRLESLKEKICLRIG